MSSQSHPHGELVNENVHHEESDINIRAIIGFIVALFAITIALQAAMYGLFLLFNKVEDKTQPQVSSLTPNPAKVEDFPSPSLQTTPWTDLQKLRAGETEYLNSYGWVDQTAGVARIPIDRAKALLLQKGIPVRADAVTDATEGTHYASAGESSGGRNLKAGGPDLSGTPAAPSTGAAPVPAPPGTGQPGAANAGPETQPNPSVGQPASATAAKKPGGGGATEQKKKPGGGV